MKQPIVEVLESALGVLSVEGIVDAGTEIDIQVERTRDPAHGDFASNIAMKLSKASGMKPRDLAEKIVEALPDSPAVASVEVAGPGFINFHLAENAYLELIDQIRTAGDAYGHSDMGQGKKVMVEFVSTNPTGPLHVGHGRGAAYGDALARLLKAVGYDTHSEYYINDAGRQMDILALSTWLRYLELNGGQVIFPANGYQGAYLRDIANALNDHVGDQLCAETVELFEELPEDPEQRIDLLISRCKQTLGERYLMVFIAACDAMVG